MKSQNDLYFNTHRNWKLVAGEKAQWVKCLLYRLENLTLDPQHPHKTQTQWLLSVTPTLGANNKQIPGVHHPASLAKTSFSETSYLKK